jgi:hypothetical protein
MTTADTWALIHAERAAMADTWEGFTAEQWAARSANTSNRNPARTNSL